ncbi:hypothetical protein IFM89_032018 [Coptis chinensis]|uniref:U-box domain-containing protein n=1 Tax=Coptis chinensis TaxID=261450 RepID=A0A835GZ58_9MAGN|nr:hypothetical protein IFM89_032018 [Coptis chinensis]
MKNLAEVLIHGVREAKINAAMHLTTLTRTEKNELVNMGVIESLLSMLWSQDHESIEVGLNALLSLACRNERNKIHIMKSGALPALVGLLEGESVTLIELAIVTLLTLSTCKANTSTIADSGAIALLVKFLSTDCSLQAKLDAIDTLHNLSTNHQGLRFIISAGTVFYSIELINYYDKASQITEKAMCLLEKIVSSSTTGITQIAKAEAGILALVETVEDGSQQSREHAAGVLFSMCNSCREKYRELILREGAIPGLLQLRVNGTWRAKGLAKSLLLLLREESEFDSRRQLGDDLFEQIMTEIYSDEEKVANNTVKLVERMIMNHSLSDLFSAHD